MTNEELIKKYNDGDSSALDILIENNEKLVKYVVNKYSVDKYPSMDEDDLIQEGRIGLYIAATKFDIESDFKFSTYAFFWIKQRISRYVKQKSTYNEVSLNKKIGDDSNEMEQIIGIEDSEIDKVEDTLCNKNLRTSLQFLINHYLNKKEKEIIELKYGWNGDPLNFSQISNRFNISATAVRDSHNKALWKLRRTEFIRNMIAEEDKENKYNNYNSIIKYIDKKEREGKTNTFNLNVIKDNQIFSLI
ncbi:sigma-70 family RNA polymerase sigma factor [Clostridium sp.]|uniref:sigma-70 family RNA polymerase sigma factor n=1 Tax=Clostridium sp. TaxID=1506 RepID=UPI0029007340|nr:sigma-70 family RNA polymerase sigma factor [Clostridium sp.]MDU1181209.1 sigma-70 family RNA polymerase sigma factor [Clostridium sp.]MDU1228378.1 sigma-70 family RNA polymerase sigma factor [Clostridium sp.]MDU7667481.1 sigma-70 family RNA polymerase sigma factor [Escherichia coli]MDU7700446.1 sigma-70 family RNA polymerase sigma factor [Escherichia coli]